jgi:hypothetical protein
VQRAQQYIGNLMKENKLKGAQPLEQEGSVISGGKGSFKDGPFNEAKEVSAGYFLITAKNFDEAVEIAKINPMLDDTPGTRIEVRPVKTMEGIN